GESKSAITHRNRDSMTISGVGCSHRSQTLRGPVSVSELPANYQIRILGELLRDGKIRPGKRAWIRIAARRRLSKGVHGAVQLRGSIGQRNRSVVRNRRVFRRFIVMEDGAASLARCILRIDVEACLVSESRYPAQENRVKNG